MVRVDGANIGPGREEDSAYSTGSYSPSPTADSTDPRYFPQTNYFPPPPNQPIDAHYPPYNPADYPAPPSHHYPPHHIDNGPSPSGYTPEPGNPYAQQDPRYRRQDDNVSAQQYEPLFEHARARSGGSRLSPAHEYPKVSPANNAVPAADRLTAGYPLPTYQDFAPRSGDPRSNAPPPPEPMTVNQLKPPSPVAPEPVAPSDVKSVKFDLNPQEQSLDTHQREADADADEEDGARRSRHRRRDDDDREGRGHGRDGRRRRDGSADSATSEGTIELPPRFDEHGRVREVDPLASKLESVLAGLFR